MSDAPIFFTLTGYPTLPFRTVATPTPAGIACVQGVTVAGTQQTTARIADVVALDDATAFALAMALATTLYDRHTVAGRALGAISGGGPMNLTPDDVKASPTWRALYSAERKAFAAMRAHNKGARKIFGAKRVDAHARSVIAAKRAAQVAA